MKVHRMTSPRLFGAALVLATLLAGCSDDAAGPDAAGLDAIRQKPLATLEWNRFAQDMIAKHKPNQQAAQRGMAYLSLAQYAAADAATRTPPRPLTTPGAIAGASAAVLSYLHPADADLFEAEVRRREAELAPGLAKAFRDGEAVGRAVGAQVVALAQQDRFSAPWTGTVPTGPGIWYSSTVPPTPPALPQLGGMQPFLMTGGSQFRSPPPPAFGSGDFDAAVAEVRAIADTRTARQDSIAKFWVMGTGSLIAGFWNTTAADLIMRSNLGELEASKALALMNTAAMDGLIGCADAKFTYWLLRPTHADPGIKLATGLPNFPSYPSNHACFSGAAAYTLAALFPADAERLSDMAYEAALSRVYGGIHYRFDGDAGLALARDVASLTSESGAAARLLALLK